MKTISFNRLKYLFLRYFATHWKRDLTVVGALFVLRTLFNYMHFPFIDNTLILIATPFVMGNMFNFLQNKTQGVDYLLCPANTEEKVIANLFLVHIYYTAILYLACILSHYTVLLIYPHDALFLTHSTIKDLIDYNFLEALFAFQSIFIFTTVYFKKNAVLKTLISFAAFLFAIAVITMVTVICFGITNAPDKIVLESYIMEKYTWGIHIVNWIIILFFWVLSYFRLRETEV